MPDQCQSCQTPLAPGTNYCQQCGRCQTPPRRLPLAARWLLILSGALCLSAWIALLVKTESVLGTGPALFALGTALAGVSAKLRFGHGLAIGIAHGAICALFVTLVNALDWGPSEASGPFATMGGIYCTLTIPATIYAFLHIPAAHNRNECASCGYLLTGLTEPRCPECGTNFDPALLTQSEA